MWACTMVMCFACLFTFSRVPGWAWRWQFCFALYRDRKLIALMAFAVGVAVFIPQVANRITFLFTSEFDMANMFGGRGGRRREGMNLLRTVNVLFGYVLGALEALWPCKTRLIAVSAIFIWITTI